jgi:drug/metabolite transporter (DMT)-like permease
LTKKILAQIGLIFTTFIWGVTFVLVKDALNDAPPFWFGGIRFFIACVLTLLFVNKNVLKISRNELIGGTICGFWLFIGYAFQNFGLMQTTASKSAFITSVAVIFVPIILILFYKKEISKQIWASVGFAILGLYLLINPKGEGINIGDILTLGCAFSFAYHVIFQDKFIKLGVNIFRFFLVQTVVVTILSVIHGVVFEPDPIVWSNTLWLALIVTGIFATFIGILIMVWAQQILDPSQTVIIFTLEPLFASLFALIVVGEVLGFNGWIGGILIIIGVLVGEKDNK